jgi:hypothetical protein
VLVPRTREAASIGNTTKCLLRVRGALRVTQGPSLHRYREDGPVGNPESTRARPLGRRNSPQVWCSGASPGLVFRGPSPETGWCFGALPPQVGVSEHCRPRLVFRGPSPETGWCFGARPPQVCVWGSFPETVGCLGVSSLGTVWLSRPLPQNRLAVFGACRRRTEEAFSALRRMGLRLGPLPSTCPTAARAWPNGTASQLCANARARPALARRAGGHHAPLDRRTAGRSSPPRARGYTPQPRDRRREAPVFFAVPRFEALDAFEVLDAFDVRAARRFEPDAGFAELREGLATARRAAERGVVRRRLVSIPPGSISVISDCCLLLGLVFLLRGMVVSPWKCTRTGRTCRLCRRMRFEGHCRANVRQAPGVTAPGDRRATRAATARRGPTG